MGLCISSIRVSGSNSNTGGGGAVNHNRYEIARPQATTGTTKAGEKNKQKIGGEENAAANKKKKKQSGVIPCGKRTDFGYAKDFDQKYTIGKLLGHGQFGYTYVATDKTNGDRVAVKRIEKNKVL